MIWEIKFDDIVVADEHTDNYDKIRCKNGLWGIYNAIKKMARNHPRVLECLFMIGANAAFVDSGMNALLYTGKTNEKYRRTMPAAKYLFGLEEYGFAINSLVTTQEETRKNKINMKDIERFTLSYHANDFDNVIFGLKLFADICMKQSSPLTCFQAGDIRAAFSAGSTLRTIPAHQMDFKEQKATKPPIEELCAYFLTDSGLKSGMERLLNLSKELKMKPCWYGTNSYKCSYKGKKVASYSVGGKVSNQNSEKNWLTVSVALADRNELGAELEELPEDIRMEYLSNLRLCTHCGMCTPSELVVFGVNYGYDCTASGYQCHNPTPEQFRWIERFIGIRREYIMRTSKR